MIDAVFRTSRLRSLRPTNQLPSYVHLDGHVWATSFLCAISPPSPKEAKPRENAGFTHNFTCFFAFWRIHAQAGLAIDPNNGGLESSLTVAKEAAETDRRERWRKAGLERAAEDERLKKQDALKAKAKADAAADAAKAGAAGGGGSAAATDASGDPLSSFFTEIQGEESKPPPKKVERVLHDKYTNQELGTPKEQMDRLLQHNYKWKNLNAFETLQLGPDATVEDIKQRCV